jgi:O-Antigen ligase
VRAEPRRPLGLDLALVALGAATILLVTYAAAAPQIGLAVLLGVSLYVAAVAGFLRVPHVTVAATVVLFALIPSLKVFVGDWVGAVKDVVVVGAVSAGIVLCVSERRLPDRWILIPVGLVLGLYVVNLGGGHGVAWAQGVRLIGEPLLLLLVGLMLPQARRTFRWAFGALVATACLVAAYGLLQQAAGEWTVVDWGYSFAKQVRTSNGHFRSFGTFDDPFAYAAFLLFGIGVLMFWLRRGALVWAAGALMLAGLFFSYVRTSALVLVAFIGLLVIRRRHLSVKAVAIATSALIAVAVVGTVVLGGAQRTQKIERNVPTSNGKRIETVLSRKVALNGRASAWKAALGDDPRQWIFGRGVGKVGTAAERSQYTVTPSSAAVDPAIRQAACLRGQLKSCPVDSGYLATVADVGVVGLLALLALCGRLLVLSAGAALRGSDAGWVALALLAGLLLDALVRASFTGFPTAFLGLLLVGIALASAREEGQSERLTASSAT